MTGTDYNERKNRAENLWTLLGEKIAFTDTELFALSAAEHEKLFSDDHLRVYEYYLSRYLDEANKPMSEEVMATYSKFETTLGEPKEIYEVLTTSELPMPDAIEMSGSEREQYIAAQKQQAQHYTKLQNTLAGLLDAHVSGVWASVQAKGKDSVKKYMLSQNNVPTTIFNTLINSASGSISLYQRYLALKKQALGIDKLYDFDTMTPSSQFAEASGYDSELLYADFISRSV